MKKLFTLIGMLMLVATFNVQAGVETRNEVANDKDVQVYYFHATARCATCKAVEAVTLEALKEFYGEKVVFTSINREKDKENPLIKKHKVNGQTLLVVKDKKVVNLTTEAFLNARNKPEKFKELIKTTIDPLLK